MKMQKYFVTCFVTGQRHGQKYFAGVLRSWLQQTLCPSLADAQGSEAQEAAGEAAMNAAAWDEGDAREPGKFLG